MGLFSKKGPEIGQGDENPAEQEVEEVSSKNESISKEKVEVEIAKLHGQLDSLIEMRKATSERFGIINEQIGELRGMITNLNQQFSKVEVESTKAIDKVNSVQPETFNTSLRKSEGKIDALKANIESNESLMKDVMKEVKGMRQKMDLYKGTEQILKLHEEVKIELSNIKKVEAIVERHANRVESMFMDIEKKFSEFDKFNSTVKELSRSFEKLLTDFDKMKVKTDGKADKKEFVTLLNKFNDFEKHTGNIVKLLDDRSKHLKDDMSIMFNSLRVKLENKFNVKLDISPTSIEKEDKPKRGLFGLFGKKKEESGEEVKGDVSEQEPAQELAKESIQETPPVEETKTESLVEDVTKESNSQEK